MLRTNTLLFKDSSTQAYTILWLIGENINRGEKIKPYHHAEKIQGGTITVALANQSSIKM